VGGVVRDRLGLGFFCCAWGAFCSASHMSNKTLSVAAVPVKIARIPNALAASHGLYLLLAPDVLRRRHRP